MCSILAGAKVSGTATYLDLIVIIILVLIIFFLIIVPIQIFAFTLVVLITFLIVIRSTPRGRCSLDFAPGSLVFVVLIVFVVLLGVAANFRRRVEVLFVLGILRPIVITRVAHRDQCNWYKYGWRDRPAVTEISRRVKEKKKGQMSAIWRR
jgi:hypothetical protein